MSLVRLTKETAARDEALQRLYDEEANSEKVSRLNSLYVAITRARRELYVIGVKRPGDSFPFDLLPETGFAPGDPGPAAKATAAGEPGPRLSHAVGRMSMDFPRGSLNRAERRRGDLAHRMLSLVREAGDDLEAALADAADRAATEARDAASGQGLAEAAALLIRETGLLQYFAPAPGRAILTEQEYCDAEGRLFRMDRVVVDPDRVTVIDYKTGPGVEDEHLHEVEGYARILEGAYPGRRIEADPRVPRQARAAEGAVNALLIPAADRLVEAVARLHRGVRCPAAADRGRLPRQEAFPLPAPAPCRGEARRVRAPAHPLDGRDGRRGLRGAPGPGRGGPAEGRGDRRRGAAVRDPAGGEGAPGR